MIYCKKHGDKIISYVTKIKGGEKYKVCPVCDKISKRIVIFEKISKKDFDIFYFREQLIQNLRDSVGIPKHMFDV